MPGGEIATRLGGVRSRVARIGNLPLTDAYRRAVVAASGLGAADLATLSLLHREEPQQASRIGASTGLTAGSVTALFDRLEAGGYVTRWPPSRRSTRPSPNSPLTRCTGVSRYATATATGVSRNCHGRTTPTSTTSASTSPPATTAPM